ncbi:hypothetical protein [Listeria grandensis]|uniref:hypothetical protein n=2 Tax=Listeria grandensis TaxID=1494963 RepID=UPI00164E3B4C|nr:hypothetical protein [Listeria grandensis]MBC6315528.1 hypothetical protein [Listeria grandensis]
MKQFATMLKIWRSPVILTGSIMIVSALFLWIGYLFPILYFQETEPGWILTTLIGGILVLGFGFMWSWKERVNVKKRLK